MYINLITIDLCPGQSGGGVTPAGTLTIEHNGEYNVYSYASASVDVHPSVSLSETYLSNGSYTITGEFNGGMVTVNVPSPQFVTEPLSVSANGTYTPGEGVDGYSQVVVDVPQSVTGFTEKDLTEGAIEIINLDNSASFVASFAFERNKTIQTVNLPYATIVNDYAFYWCPSLSQINLPVCSYIDNSAFYLCESLSQISLPVCLSIDTEAFARCNSLSQINLPMCKSISYQAFQECHSLNQVSLPVCNYIGNWAFWMCYSLNQVSLPVCSIISDRAFQECSSLSQISLPVCSIIGYNEFDGCSSLSIITIGYSGVCSLNNIEAFNRTKITSSTGSIYVPASLVDSYKSANNWSYFSTQIFPIE